MSDPHSVWKTPLWFGALLACGALFLQSSPASAGTDPPARPNVVLILADDLGWGSIGSYGADSRLVRTPNIDRIAAEGMRFLDASTPSSVCSPTRYGLLTGRYAWRRGNRYRAHPFVPLLIEPDRLTLASLLRDAGYRTAAIGKWHLGYGSQRRLDYRDELQPGPLEIGFDHHFGVPSNHGDVTGVFVEDRAVYGLRSKRLAPAEVAEVAPAEVAPAEVAGQNFRGMDFVGLDAPQRVDQEVMQVLTDRAVEWLEEQRAGTPFFLYFAPVAVHRPITPSTEVEGSSGAGPYGDWIHDLDLAVGRIVAALERRSALDDTLLIFTSDNGGVLNLRKESHAKTAFDRGLAINGPFRGGKRSIYEGGFRVPLIVRWPGTVRAGTTSEQTVSLVDVLATVAEALGLELPEPGGGAEDSWSFRAALEGRSDPGPARPHLISQSLDGVYAIRWGPWKWIEGVAHDPRTGANRERGREQRPQLYDLRLDRSESTDLLGSRPEVAELLKKMLEHYRRRGSSREPRSAEDLGLIRGAG